jgi:hypothetical protein
MFREQTSDALSRFVMLVHTPNDGLALRWRDQVGEWSQEIRLGKVSLPIYLKLERKSDTFTAYSSPDGQAWGQALGSHTISLSRDLKVGLCANANNNLTTSTMTYDQVKVE